MESKLNIMVPGEKIAEFCKKNHILKLAFFGSVLTDHFRPDSDVDVLVNFEPGNGPGFLGLPIWKESFLKSWEEKST